MSRTRDIRPPVIDDPYAVPQADGNCSVLTEFTSCDYCLKRPMRPDSAYCSDACRFMAEDDGA